MDRMEETLYYLIGIILGLIPEVLYFTLFLIFTKNIKEKKILLFLLMSIGYMLCICIQQYVLLYYLGYIVIVYLILKFLYKNQTQIIDIFVFSISTLYLTFLSYLGFKCFKNDLSNYWIMFILDRILMFVPFIFKNKFNILYKEYCKLWNRNNKEKRPIKSITLRNISLIIINFAICFMNIYAISIIKFLN